MKRLFIFVYLSALAMGAAAETWEDVTALPGLKISIDKDSLGRDGSVFWGWQRWAYSEDQVFQGVTYRVSKSLIYTDCAKRTRANAHVLLLSEGGSIVYDRRSPVFAFAPLIQDTSPMTVHFKICARYGSKP